MKMFNFKQVYYACACLLLFIIFTIMDVNSYVEARSTYTYVIPSHATSTMSNLETTNKSSLDPLPKLEPEKQLVYITEDMKFDYMDEYNQRMEQLQMEEELEAIESAQVEVTEPVQQTYEYTEPASNEVEQTNTVESESVSSSYSDEFMTICSVVEAETHGADMESKMRIACVIRNRVNDSRFPNSYYGVCTQANQFASRWDIDQSTIDAVNAALNGGDITGGALWFCTCSSGCWASSNATYLFTDSVGHHFWC